MGVLCFGSCLGFLSVTIFPASGKWSSVVLNVPISMRLNPSNSRGLGGIIPFVVEFVVAVVCGEAHVGFTELTDGVGDLVGGGVAFGDVPVEVLGVALPSSAVAEAWVAVETRRDLSEEFI